MTGFIYCCGGLAGGLLGVVDVDDVLPKLLEVFVPEFPKLPKPLLAAPCCPNPLLDGFCAPLKPPPKLPKLEDEPGPELKFVLGDWPFPPGCPPLICDKAPAAAFMASLVGS